MAVINFKVLPAASAAASAAAAAANSIYNCHMMAMAPIAQSDLFKAKNVKMTKNLIFVRLSSK